MKKLTSIILFLLLGSFAYAQTGQAVANLSLTDPSGKAATIPHFKQKTLVLFYVDPDVQTIIDPMTYAIEKKNYDRSKFASGAVVNAKDTWIPNNLIQMKIKSKQKRFPETVFLLDKKHILRDGWKVGESDGTVSVFVIDATGKLKYTGKYKTQADADKDIKNVLSAIDAAL